MKVKIDYKTVCSVLFGCFVVSAVNFIIASNANGLKRVEIILCGGVVIVLASLYGSITGIFVPITAGFVCASVLPGTLAMEELVVLLILGFSSGHYSDKFKITEGEFKGRCVVDFILIQTTLNVVLSIFVCPMIAFAFGGGEIVKEFHLGLNLFCMALLLVIFVCTPVLMILSRWFRKKNAIVEVTVNN